MTANLKIFRCLSLEERVREDKMGSSVFDSSVFTNLRFKDYNKSRIFKRLIRVFDENKYENYFFKENQEKEKDDEYKKKTKFFIQNFRKKYWTRIPGTHFYEPKEEFLGYNPVFLEFNIQIYYVLTKSEVKGDIKEFILKEIIPGFRIPLWAKNNIREAASNFLLALKWFYNETQKNFILKFA
jgi:hypothetical protein